MVAARRTISHTHAGYAEARREACERQHLKETHRASQLRSPTSSCTGAATAAPGCCPANGRRRRTPSSPVPRWPGAKTGLRQPVRSRPIATMHSRCRMRTPHHAGLSELRLTPTSNIDRRTEHLDRARAAGVRHRRRGDRGSLRAVVVCYRAQTRPEPVDSAGMRRPRRGRWMSRHRPRPRAALRCGATTASSTHTPRAAAAA